MMIKHVILVVAGVVLAAFFLLYVFQRHLIYHPSQERPRLSDDHVEGMRVVNLHTQDGLTLMAWYKPAAERYPTLLYLHGNAGNIGGRMSLVRQLTETGLGVLLLEYRGYGGNPGAPSELGLYEDGRAGMRFLQQQGVGLKQTVLYGESLGTGVATKMAVENQVCAVVLQSPYTSLPDVSRYYYPYVWFEPKDKFDSLKRIKAIQAPLLVLHGTQDTVVPYAQGLTLFQNAKEPKKMVPFDQAGHNSIWDAPGFVAHVLGFVKEHCS